MADLDFWNARLRSHGHTGWADAATYAYDQRLRLRAVGHLISTGLPPQRLRALDFGCGTGDFSALLARQFAAVTAHDISDDILAVAALRVAAPNVLWSSDRAAALAGGAYDLILSITVLQHVAADAELEALARVFSAALTPTGCVILLESLATTPTAPNAYTRLRTANELAALFGAAGLKLRQRQAFHHPVDSPTPGFAHYRRRMDVRMLGRLANHGSGWARRRLNAVAERCAAQDNAALSDRDGATQLMVFTPANGADGG